MDVDRYGIYIKFVLVLATGVCITQGWLSDQWGTIAVGLIAVIPSSASNLARKPL